jgi:hypothetical protein
LKNVARVQEDEVIQCFFAQHTMKAFNVRIRVRHPIRSRYPLPTHSVAQPEIEVTSVAKALSPRGRHHDIARRFRHYRATGNVGRHSKRLTPNLLLGGQELQCLVDELNRAEVIWSYCAILDSLTDVEISGSLELGEVGGYRHTGVT